MTGDHRAGAATWADHSIVPSGNAALLDRADASKARGKTSALARGVAAALCVSVLALASACAPAAPAAPATTPPAASSPVASGSSPAPGGSPQSSPSVLAPAASPAAAASGPATVVRIGGLTGTADRAIWTGQDLGFYAQQGIQLDYTTYGSFAEMLPLLATGQLDVGAGGLSPALFNALERGISVKIVSDVSLAGPPPPGHHMSYGLMVRSGLKDQVKSAADLKGLTLAVNGAQGIGQLQLEHVLETGGLTTADVNVQTLAFPDAYAALASGKVDGALELEPFITLGIQQNTAFPLVDLGTVTPGDVSQWVFYSANFIQNNPDAGKRFLTGYTQALRWMNDGFFKNVNQDDVIQEFTQHTQDKNPNDYATETQTPNELNANVNLDAVQRDEDYFVAQGWQQSNIDPHEVVDTSFGDYVRQTLGPYQ